MSWPEVVSALVTLAVVVDPIGLAPAYVALTRGIRPSTRRQIALRATAIATAVLAFFALAGGQLLATLEISLPAFRIAGGLLLFAVAFDMVLGTRAARETQTAEQAVQDEHARDLAVFPLAIPLIAGPGAITATLLLAGKAAGDPARLAVLIGVIVIVMAGCWLVFRLAPRLARVMGSTGTHIVSRLLGILLAALAVQYVIDGVRAAMAG